MSAAQIPAVVQGHTPGPWTTNNLEPNTYGWDWVDGPDRRQIAVCHEIGGNASRGYCDRVSIEEIAANARLIAAAPEMLEALRHMVRWHDQLSAADIAKAEAIIAKATGA